jgi:hypothetical protein
VISRFEIVRREVAIGLTDVVSRLWRDDNDHLGL